MRISDWSSDVCSSDLIDRDVAGDLGIDVSTVANTLAAALGDYRVSTFSYGTRNYNVIVELDERVVSQEEGIGLIQVESTDGDQIPLSRLVRLRSDERRIGKEGDSTVKYRGLPS